PHAIWRWFYALNQIPRASKKEEQVTAFIVDFAKNHQLNYQTDELGNVLVSKKIQGQPNYDKPIVLQAHLDMVHQKNANTDFDFDKDPIAMYVEGDWVKAKGTTLGADNGLGVAAMLAVLSDTEISHPPIEALFTIDEETGMTGAKTLNTNWLTGDYLLNLDTEEDDEIGIGCAGGVDVTARKSYPTKSIAKAQKAYKLSVNGLNGGHSGMDIHKGLGNANVLLTRILYALLPTQIELISIRGGNLRNAIPREAAAKFYCFEDDVEKLFDLIKNDINNEYRLLEPLLNISLESKTSTDGAIAKHDSRRLIESLRSIPNGVHRMSPSVEALVETSNNLARVVVDLGKVEIACLTRSSVESSKEDLVQIISSGLNLEQFEVSLSGDYPGWEPINDSKPVRCLAAVYRNLFKEEPKIAACHAGLECGIIGSKYPAMQMASFGPTIKG
ncbi:MAG: aminoacyl-histidine dipeptidase, partial [Flavobacteriaceae bacterium]|nr:aminoacyl-histidine dipeptidase [Flavobacteriaceae bacterium]